MEVGLTRNSYDEILAECSDEEEYDRLGIKCGSSWSPFPTQISALYSEVANNSLKFTWKCPGERKNPDDETPPTPAPLQNKPSSKIETEQEATDFDFEEEVKAVPQPHISRFGKTGVLKANKKKSQSLAGILSSMERHRLLDMDQKLIENKSPNPSYSANMSRGRSSGAP